MSQIQKSSQQLSAHARSISPLSSQLGAGFTTAAQGATEFGVVAQNATTRIASIRMV